jgi:glycosyltransferase involved in cell wall biosynthesis
MDRARAVAFDSRRDWKRHMNDPMARSIFFLVSHSSAGGAQEIWVNLAEAFRLRGNPVHLFALYPLRSTVRETPADLPWRYVLERRPAGPIAMWRLLRGLVQLIRRERPDLIVTAMPAANVLAAVAARLAGTGTRVVISHHSPVETHNPLLNRIDGFAGSLGSVQAVVSVSDSVAKTLERKPAAYRGKRQTIHNALPPTIEARLAALAAARGDGARTGRTLVATGRLAAQKNYPLLIRAAVHMPDVAIEIVGNGPDEAALIDLAAELGVAGRVRFLGHQPRLDAMEILARGDVFAQVSLFEGHSLGLIEAAKLGLPLIVSDVPVQIEGITAADGERCGIVVGTDDAVGLGRAVTDLLNDPVARAHRSAQARKLAAGATFDRMVERYEAVLG